MLLNTMDINNVPLSRDFQRETDTYINPERQIKYEQELEYDDLEL